MAYELWYWPGIPGRGEFVRLVFEAARIPYTEPPREKGAEVLLKEMDRRQRGGGFVPYAPPFLTDGDFCIAQVAHILAWLADRHGFGGGDLATDLGLIQLQLTISDMVAEVHAVHHPISTSLYYEDQKQAAHDAAEHFRTERIPKFLDFFEASFAGDGPYLLGDNWTHGDSSLALLIDGLCYMFPLHMETLTGAYPRLFTLRDTFMALPEIRAYRASDRCQAFNTDGIFRHYPEMDA